MRGERRGAENLGSLLLNKHPISLLHNNHLFLVFVQEMIDSVERILERIDVEIVFQGV
jgi:hypothetical protein